VERMKKYEVMYIIRPNVDEEGKKNIIEKINNVFVKAASTVSEVKEWGLRELAYEIDGETKGYYVLLNVEATPEAVKEFDRVANIDEAVIRHIVIAL
jgi:small subunit ribosomal protein S6